MSKGPHVGSGLISFNLIETNQILVGNGKKFIIAGIGVYNVDVYTGCFCVCDWYIALPPDRPVITGPSISTQPCSMVVSALLSCPLQSKYKH